MAAGNGLGYPQKLWITLWIAGQLHTRATHDKGQFSLWSNFDHGISALLFNKLQMLSKMSLRLRPVTWRI
jgi:hypothetical protein